jgi:O-antigen/teichoic acid export membrane protein
MIIDTYAPVRRMNTELQPRPDPAGSSAAGESSHAPAVLRNSALQIGGHAGAIALTAASTIVLTRFLGVDDYGRFTVLTIFLLIGASLSEFGLNGTAIRWFARGERPEDVFASLIGLRLVLSSAAAVVALVVFVLYPHSETPFAAVILTTIAMVLAGVNLTIPTALQARLDFRLAVVLDLTARAVTFAVFATAAVIITSKSADQRLVAAAFALPTGYLVAVVVGLAAVRRLSFPIVPTFDPATWRRLLRDAAPLGVVMILGLASYRLDALVLALLQDSYAVGIYGLAYRFMEAALPIGTVITFAIFPLLVRDEPDHERRSLQIARAVDLLLVAAVAIAVGTIVLAPDLVRALGGDAYAPSVVPLRILVLSVPFTFVGMILSWTLIARGLQHRLIPIVAVSLTINLALNLALVPTYSYKASAAVTLATEALGAVTLVYFVRRWLSVSPALGSVLKIAASGGIALGAGLLCTELTGDIVGTAVTIVIFAGLVLGLGLVTRDEIAALMRGGSRS